MNFFLIIQNFIFVEVSITVQGEISRGCHMFIYNTLGTPLGEGGENFFGDRYHHITRQQHIGLARWCELFILAPATANTLAAVAAGLTPELVSLVACALPRQTPAVFAPAMNADMWLNPITQRNVDSSESSINARPATNRGNTGLR